jgi:3-hydroxy-D-aspartate aldolase
VRRDRIATPSLVLERETLDDNIARMMDFARSRAIGLRPHAKSHKSVDIARRLVKAGALGACCATIHEAEALAGGGIDGLLVTSPLAARDMLERLSRLLARGADLMVVADHPDNVVELAEIAAAQNCVLPVVVELDVGLARTGCADVASAVRLAGLIARQPSLRFKGVQAYWGGLQQIMPFTEREKRVAAEARKLRALVDALKARGLAPELVSGGGTGTHWLDTSLGIFTELQVGTFLLMDSLYSAVPLTPDGNPFVPALFLAASVISASHPGQVTINAGLKAFATDSGKPVPMRGAPRGSTYAFMGDEHGVVRFSKGKPPALGATIELLTSHCDPTVNLHHAYKVVSGNEIVDEWPISARGY